MLYFPERMRKGDVPNVDFLHLYGPGSLYVLMGWSKLFGDTLTAERTFGLIQHLGIVFGLFTLARPWGRKAATAVGALAVFYVITPIGLTAMAWNGGLALLLWSGVFAVRATALVRTATARDRRLLVAGVLSGLALTYRPDLAIAVALVLGWLVWTRRHLWAPSVLGVAVGLIPMWVHLAVAGPAAAWDGMFVDPVFHLRAGRELPAPAVVVAPRRRVAGDRRDRAAVVAVAAPRGVERAVPVVLRDARQHGRVPGVRAVAAPARPLGAHDGAAGGRAHLRSGSCHKRCNAPTPRTSRGSRASRGRSQWSWSPRWRRPCGRGSAPAVPSPSAARSRSSSRSR